MTLRFRFTLWFGLASLIPIVVAAVITRQTVINRRRAEFDRLLLQAREQAENELSALGAKVRDAVDQLATRDNMLVGGLLVELGKGDGDLSSAARMDLKQRGPQAMHLAGLDQVVVVDDKDEVLVSPHFQAHVGEIDARPATLVREQAEGVSLGFYDVLRQGTMTQVLALEAARVVSDGEQKVVVLGGRELDTSLLDKIRRPGSVRAWLVDKHGRNLLSDEPVPDALRAGAPSVRSTTPTSDAPRVSVAVAGSDDLAGARILILVPNDDLNQTLLDVDVRATSLAGLSLLIAVALGFITSRRIARDARALAAGAQAVARGDLSQRVDVRGRDELAKLADGFNQMTRELRESKQRLVRAERIAAWREVAKRLAHEIKNPLTPIQMSVETMRRTHESKHPSFEEIFDESTRTILEEVERLKRIVGEFSKFARMPKPNRQSCRLDELVTGALALYQGSVEVRRDLATDLPAIFADRDQVTQVILNLVENARDAIAETGAGPANGYIVVRCRTRDGSVELEVEDTGPGLAPDTLDKIFAPYFTTKKIGTGLGLAIVERIVTDHGGTISVVSEPGQGARFIILFPSDPAVPSV